MNCLNFREWSIATALVLMPLSAVAQDVPPKPVQEILIKTTLLTLNDANVTGNYDVLFARTSKASQKIVTAEQLKTGFKTFVDQKIELWTVAVKPAVIDKAAVSSDGKLQLIGSFPMEGGSLTYDLKYILENGDWEIFDIDVGTKPN